MCPIRGWEVGGGFKGLLMVPVYVFSFLMSIVLFRRGPIPIFIWYRDMDSLIYMYYNTSCRYKDMDKDAGMTILDIGLLTGYTADIEDLNKVRHFCIC